MEVTLAIIADAANISKENKLNVLGVFNRFNARQFPAKHPDFTLVLRLEAGPAERGESKRLAIRLLDTDGTMVHETTVSFTVPDEQVRPDFSSYVLLAIRNLEIAKPGAYAFHVLINGEERGRIPLDVRQVEAPSPAGEVPQD